MVEVPEIVVHEADEPDLILDLFDAHPLPGKDLTEVDLPSVVADAATVGHRGRPVVERIVQLTQTAIRPGRRNVALGRDLHLQRLVRALPVVVVNECVEPGLLLQEVGGRWSGRFGLERQMHPLVPPVLLGMPRLDTLDGDAEPEPPHREPAQPVEGHGTGKGHPRCRCGWRSAIRSP